MNSTPVSRPSPLSAAPHAVPLPFYGTPAPAPNEGNPTPVSYLLPDVFFSAAPTAAPPTFITNAPTPSRGMIGTPAQTLSTPESPFSDGDPMEWEYTTSPSPTRAPAAAGAPTTSSWFDTSFPWTATLSNTTTPGGFFEAPAAPAPPTGVQWVAPADAALEQALTAVENQRKELEKMVWGSPRGSCVNAAESQALRVSPYSASSVFPKRSAALKAPVRIHPRGFVFPKPKSVSIGMPWMAPTMSPNPFIASSTKRLVIKSMPPKPSMLIKSVPPKPSMRLNLKEVEVMDMAIGERTK